MLYNRSKFRLNKEAKTPRFPENSPLQLSPTTEILCENQVQVSSAPPSVSIINNVTVCLVSQTAPRFGALFHFFYPCVFRVMCSDLTTASRSLQARFAIIASLGPERNKPLKRAILTLSCSAAPFGFQ